MVGDKAEDCEADQFHASVQLCTLLRPCPCPEPTQVNSVRTSPLQASRPHWGLWALRTFPGPRCHWP